MRYIILALTVALCLALVSSSPLPETGNLRSETLDRLVMAETDNEAALRSKRTIGILRQLFPDLSQDVNPESENRVTNEDESPKEAESQNNEVRVQFDDEPPKEEGLAPLSLENESSPEDENEDRDKRQGASTQGSGNWIFDIIRLVAGSSGAGGSSGLGSSEEKAIIGPTQGMTMAIPGPFTRLLLIANRGWADLIEDVVLRMAATSEKFVNYKAKLINYLI